MADKPQLDPKLTPVLEPNFDRHNIEAPTWIHELWQEGARASVLIQTERRMTKSGSGSGFFVDKEGYIATANHVVKQTTDLKVVTFDGQTFPAEVVATRPSEDLAIIRLRNKRTPDSCQPLPIGETEGLTAGQRLFNVGHPRADKLPHISMGLVEDTRWDLESTVPSVGGNSGGSTLDHNGRVVGVSKGVRYYSGHKNTPRGNWIGDKPSSEPATYSKDSRTTTVPAESLALLLAEVDPKFKVTRYTTVWAGDHLNWVNENQPVNLSLDAAGVGSSSYLGGRLMYRNRPAALGSGLAGSVMLAIDGYQLYNAPEHEMFQGTLALAADATTVAGSILRARYAKLGTVVTGCGLLGRLGTEFVPTGVRLDVLEK